MTQSVSEEFVDMLESNKIFLKKLTLIKLDMTDDVFFKLAKHVSKKGSFLKELNLSDNSVRPFVFSRMLVALYKNKSLTHVDISKNTLLAAAPDDNEPDGPDEEKPYWTETQRALHDDEIL